MTLFDSLALTLAESLTVDETSAFTAPEHWREWVPALFPAHCKAPFATRHADLWEWVWAIEAGKRPPPYVAVWPRGGAKSTTAEMACVAIGARNVRPYALYVCETQEQADDHVQNIGSLLESSEVAAYYPDLASRLVNKFGNSKGWRRNRLRTAAGFTIDALGLDTAARGIKLEENRPGLMIFDDIDNELDKPAATAKKIKILTKRIIPAGSNDLAILAVQNLVHEHSIFSRLVDGRADFMADRIVSGPYPAIENLEYEQQGGRYVITRGTATWEGQSVERCQEMVDDMGISAFLSESQHEVEPPAGGVFSHLVYKRCSWDEIPDLVRTVVWVDPAVTDTDQSDSHAIQADGIDAKGNIYRLYSWEGRTTPQDSMERAISKAMELGADSVGVETDQGGDTWQSVYDMAWNALVDKTVGTAEEGALDREVYEARKAMQRRKPKFRQAKAGAGHGPKVHRASQMLVDYERGKITHVEGTHQTLERALRRFPITKPYDLTDCSYWSWYDLRHGKRGWAWGMSA